MFRAQCWALPGRGSMATTGAGWQGAGRNPDVLLALPHASSSLLHEQAPISSGRGTWSNGYQDLCASSAQSSQQRRRQQQVLAGHKFKTTVALSPSWVVFCFFVLFF